MDKKEFVSKRREDHTRLCQGFPCPACKKRSQEILEEIGKLLASRLPNYYGNVQFNLQGGICTIVNMGWTEKPKG